MGAADVFTESISEGGVVIGLSGGIVYWIEYLDKSELID